ncbi:MAG: GNAT family N-acetyltransferase [Candidatus Aminicenantaceae bacterium]
MKILNLNSYDDARLFWMELSRNYKNGELTLDWTANKLIWDQFYRNRNFLLNIIVGIQDGCCTGIFPLIFGDHDMNGIPYWSFNDDFIISKEYFCPPEEIHRFLKHLPPHLCDDLSCFYVPEKTHHFYRAARGLVDMKPSQEEYFQSLKKKYRHDMRRTWKKNEDVEVFADNRLHEDKIKAVLECHLDYWRQKNGAVSEEYISYSRDKILTDLLLLRRAEELGKLIALYFYLEGELVAANFSIQREQDRVDDYLCLRNSRDHFSSRGLGFFAILKNMEHCRQMGIKYYDLSSCLNDYKRKFVNMLTFSYLMPFDGIPIEDGVSQLA